MDQDIPFLDPEVASLSRDIRADLAEQGRNDLFFFAKGVLGYHIMNSKNKAVEKAVASVKSAATSKKNSSMRKQT